MKEKTYQNLPLNPERQSFIDESESSSISFIDLDSAYHKNRRRRSLFSFKILVTSIILALILISIIFTQFCNYFSERHYSGQKYNRNFEKRSKNEQPLIYKNETSSLSYHFPRKLVNESYVSFLNSDINNFYNIHSHNDEWRPIPLFGALSRNFKSIEADAYFEDGKFSSIVVTHDIKSKSAKRIGGYPSLKNMYLSPIKFMLDEINDGNTWRGLYHNFPHISTILMIDIKDDSGIAFVDQLLDELEFMEQYITYFDLNADKIVYKPVSIVLTGNIPIDYLVKRNNISISQEPQRRHLFIDHDLKFTKTAKSKYNIEKWCLSASASYDSMLRFLDNCTIKDVKNLTKKYNIFSRIWDVKQTHTYPEQDMKQQLIEKYDISYIQAVNKYYDNRNKNFKIQKDLEIWKGLLIDGKINMANTDDLDFMVYVYNKIGLAILKKQILEKIL